METPRTLSPALWTRFREEHWDRRPAVLRQALAPPLATAAEVFEALRHASDALRAGEPGVPLQIVTQEETELKGADLAEHLPNESDSGAEAYVERVTRRLNGGKFALLINGLQRYSPLFWQRMRGFLKPLLPLIPAAATSPAVFLGNYDRTPFGIHRDPSSIFLFVFHGRKRLRVWPGNAFLDEGPAGHPRTYQSLRHMRPEVDEAAVLEHAALLEGGAGDILFFPSTYWHIGECVDRFTLSISAGLTPLFPADDVWARLSAGLEERMRSVVSERCVPYSLEDLGQSVDAVPMLAKRACREMEMVSESAALRHALEVEWLNATTAGGCQPVPPPLPWPQLDDAAVLRGSRDFPVRRLFAPDRKLVLSANGTSFTLPANPRVVQLVERLNTGEFLGVGRVLDEYAGEGEQDGAPYRASREGLRTVLCKLITCRALETVSVPEAEAGR